MDVLQLVPWQGIGWGGIVMLVVLLIIRGDLVPRKYYEEALATIAVKDATITAQQQQISMLLRTQSIANSALTTVEQVARERSSAETPGGPG